MFRKFRQRKVYDVEDAQQGEDSPNTFWILTVSLLALAVIGTALLWYFGVF